MGDYDCVCGKEYKTLRGLLKHLEIDGDAPTGLLKKISNMRKRSEKYDINSCGYLCMACHAMLLGKCDGCTYYRLEENCDRCWA
jgi:hypothetical protein